MKYHQGVGGGRRKKGGRSTHEIRRKSVYKAREGEPVGSNRGGEEGGVRACEKLESIACARVKNWKASRVRVRKT